MKFTSLLRTLPSAITALFVAGLLSSCADSIDSDTLAHIQEPSPYIHASSDYIAILGDLQAHSYYRYSTHLAAPIHWLKCQHAHTGNIKALLQTGDLSEQNLYKEWDFCRNQFSHLRDIIPVISCTGNHDYDWGRQQVIHSRNSTQFSQFISDALPESIITERYEAEKIDNMVVKLEINSKPLYIMALEFAPRPEVVEWADSIVSATPERKYILMTHEFIYNHQRVNDAASYARRQFPDLSGSTPETVWQTLVYPHNNVLAVLCGHNGYSEQVYSTNQAGRTVPQIMFNLQYQQYDNLSEVMLWEFVKDAHTVNVFVFNTLSGLPETREGTAFTLSLPF